MNNFLLNNIPIFHRKTIFFLAIVLVAATGAVSAKQVERGERELSIRDAIVRIYTVKNQPDYFRPWSMLGSRNVSGSGCIIKGKKILTNAHVVSNHTFIQIRRYGQARRHKAKVLSVSHEVDLAILTVEDDSFFSGVTPLELEELPKPQQEVLVYGFPVGGDSLSITGGILSRIEHQRYIHSGGKFLAGQIDAAINPGNSGGPVIVNGHIVGVVMQARGPSHSENIGYMVPTPIIEHFFQDISDGRYDGFPNIGLVTQKMENPGLKHRYNTSQQQTGILVNHVHLKSPAKGKVKEGDVLLAVDGHLIADDGTVEFRPKERTNFRYFIESHQVGEQVNLEILRQGVPKSISLEIGRTEKDYLLVHRKQYDKFPRYFVFGGFVFTPLTQNLMKRWGHKWQSSAPKEFMTELLKWPTEEKKEVVVALQTLAADINKGYHTLHSWIIREVNGKKFKDFNDFYRIMTTSNEPFIVLRNKKKFQVVIDRKEAELSHKKILEIYRIKEDRSPNLPRM